MEPAREDDVEPPTAVESTRPLRPPPTAEPLLARGGGVPETDATEAAEGDMEAERDDFHALAWERNDDAVEAVTRVEAPAPPEGLMSTAPAPRPLASLDE